MFQLDYFLTWNSYLIGGAIDVIKKDIEVLEKMGCTHIQIEAREEYGDISIEIKPVCYREETDEEFAERCQKEENRLKEIERREKAELDRLKRKYGEI